MKSVALVKNWAEDTTPEILKSIHKDEINITIYNRDISMLQNEIDVLLAQNIKFNAYGNSNQILNEFRNISKLKETSSIFKDIENLLIHFKEITNATTVRLFLGVIKTNMCLKFHTDVNDLRMLCTYKGSSTLWLTEDNVNRKELNAYSDNEAIVYNPEEIQQTQTGAVIILKGSKYKNGTIKAVVHRSPTIENKNEKRLLLRIDTDQFLNKR